MSFANLLKKGSLRGFATATPATPATDRPNIPPSVATVATVAVARAPDSATNDAPDTWNGCIPAGTSPETIVKFRAASLALDAAQRAAGVPPLGDPDADCWPHSAAMNGTEIDTFTARLARFTDMGLTLDAGERLADKLVIRDRDRDDRRHCLECLHLHGGWRCGNWQRAGVAVRARDAQLPTDFVDLLQRCDGFSDAVPMTPPRHQIIASRASCTIWRPI